jgi:3-dehydroquinate synthase
MPPYVQSFAIQVRYPVYFGRGVFRAQSRDLRDAFTGSPAEPRASTGAGKHRVLAVIDSGLARAQPRLASDIRDYARAHADAIELVGEPLVVAGGEAGKNDPAVLERLLKVLHDQSMDRHAYVLAVGGGALLDVAGYAAAITHRGVRCVRVPTTVLAQADSGVGVKNGVNGFAKKNFWGTFTPPHAVLVDASLLDSLEPRDRIAGMAEAVKVAAVRDRAFFAWLEENARALRAFEPVAVEQLVRRSAELHLEHIAQGGDPFEQGSARPLDFGHWAAHKLENMTDYRLRHGEAVAIGMALDALYSARVGLCGGVLVERLINLLRALGLSLWDTALLRREGPRAAVLSGLEDFREHLGGELTVTLLEDVGRGREVHALDHALIERCISELEARSKA